MSRVWGILILSTLVVPQLAFGEESKLARVWFGNDRYLVGPMKTDGDKVTVLDLKTFQERTFSKGEVIKAETPLSDEQAAGYVGLPAVVAYRIGERTAGADSSGLAKGKVAQVTPTAIYVSLGTARGISVGQKLSVYRPGPEIKDPDTGKILARERPKVAELEIFETAEGFSKGRIVGGLEISLLTGDEVEAEVARFMVAVMPITDEIGSESVGSSAIREQLVTALVRRNIPVVERSRLDAVLGEESLQNRGSLFDPVQAQKFGKLLGAGMIVTGKVTASNNVIEGHIRLVNTATGEILFAVSGKLLDVVDGAAFGGKVMTVSKMQELMQQARGSDYTTRRNAIKELGETKNPAAAKFLAEEMLSREPFRTADALEAMGPVAADPLIKVVQTGDFGTKSRAMRIFAKVAQKKHLPVLQTMKSDFHLRSEAERAIARLQKE